MRRHMLPEDFFLRQDKGIARESCMRKNPLFDRLHFFLNDKTLFECIQSMTGCSKIRAFQGRLYQFIPGMEHYDSWHDDLGARRLVGLSLYLGQTLYRGGFLEMRQESDKKIIARKKHQAPGDAILFKIAPGLKHRVTPVTGNCPRVVFAGWFLEGPKFTSLIR